MTETRAIPFGRPWIGDEERLAVQEVLQGPILTHGPQCKSFEEEFSKYIGTEAYCVSVSSCMAALHLSYLHMGIGQGDEVIVPAQTHVATVHAVELVGAAPVFCDCELETGNIDVSLIESLITARTKAISLVHFIGIPCDMDRVMAIAEKHSLKVVEDCAIALGAKYGGKHVGLFGDAGCFSFYPVKHITTAEGGMFVTRHRDAAEKVAMLRGFGVDRTHTERSIPGMYDVTMLGLNYRMSEMQAALGRVQLRRSNDILGLRRSNYETLKRMLSVRPGVMVLNTDNALAQNSHYCLSLVLKDGLGQMRDEVVARLNAAGIGTSIYYPGPVPMTSYYRDKYSREAGMYPCAERISASSIALPVGPHLNDDDMEYVAETFLRVIEEINL